MTGPTPANRPPRPRRPPVAVPDFLAELFRDPLDPGYAAAARRRTRSGPRTGWRHRGARTGLVAAMMAIGVLLTVAYREAVAAEPEAARARADLIQDVHDRRAGADALERQAEQLREQVARQRDEALAGGGEEITRLRELEAITGQAKVRGDGVVVRLVDAPAEIDPVTGKPSEKNLGRVLDRDLQDAANGLWAAGAEAVAINGQRLTATGTIRAAGGAILVDLRPVTGPYEIVAIGPGDMRERFLQSPTGKLFKLYVEQYHMQFSVKERDDITLDGAGDPDLHYASPVPSPSAAPSGGSPTTPGPARPSSSGGRR